MHARCATLIGLTVTDICFCANASGAKLVSPGLWKMIYRKRWGGHLYVWSVKSHSAYIHICSEVLTFKLLDYSAIDGPQKSTIKC